MPPSNQLTWRTIEQFGGIYDRRPLAQMPPNAAQVMSGCHPQPEGGLRAFFRPWRLNFKNSPDIPGDLADDLDSGPPLRVVGALVRYPSAITLITREVDTDLPPLQRAARPSFGNTEVYRTLQTTTERLANFTGNGSAVNIVGTNRRAENMLPENPYHSVVAHNGPAANASSAPTGGYFVNPEAPGNTSRGPYRIDPGGTTLEGWRHSATGDPQLLVQHQSRIVVALGNGIIFTGPGLDNFNPTPAPPPGFINFFSPVQWMIPLPPSDLLIGTLDGSIYNVQGDMADPIIRNIRNPGSGASPLTWGVHTPLGALTLVNNLPSFVGTDGSLSEAAPTLSEDHWGIRQSSYTRGYGGIYIEARNTTFQNIYIPNFTLGSRYVFARSDGLLTNKLMELYPSFLPLTSDSVSVLSDASDIDDWIDENELHLNGSLTLDTATGAWFRSVHPDVMECMSPWTHTPLSGFTSFSTSALSVIALPSVEISDPADTWAIEQPMSGQRASVYEWTSAPLHSGDGRQVRLQEVQVRATGYDTDLSPSAVIVGNPHAVYPGYVQDPTLPTPGEPSTITITATNEHGDTTSTTRTIQAGRSQVVAFPIRMTGTFIDISVKAESPHTMIEAPSVESLAFGYTEGAVVRKN